MEWKEVYIKDICTVLGDGLHGTPEYDEKGDFYFINGNNLQEGHITIKKDTKRVSQKEFLKYQKELNDRTILVSINGTIGNVAKYNNEPCILGKSACFFNVKEDIDRNFIYYVISSPHFKKSIIQQATGTTIKNVSLKQMRDYHFLIPVNLSDQRKIAGILSALDSKIENNNKINANLEAQAEALFKSWFVDFTPFKDQPFVDSELGPIPQGWKVGTLGDIANIIMGQSPAGSSYNERGNGVIFYQGRTEFGFRFPNVRLYTTMPKRYAEPMSILLSVRAPVGDINVAIEKCCIGRGLASISSKRGLHSFLLYLVKSLKNRLEVFNGEGTVFGSINKNTLMQFKIIIPPIEMQEKFNEIIQRHDCMVLELHKEIINLSTQRDTLLPKLMSGEIKL